MSCINVNAHRVGGVTIGAHRTDGIAAYTHRIGGLTVRTSLICSIGGNYLRVTPTEVQWIDVDLSALYNVITNKAWNVS